MLFKILNLFFRLIFYKSLFYILDIFQKLLFEKHFYLFNKFLNLYTTSAVSTESKKLAFTHDVDVHDELLGDSNSFIIPKKYLYYLKNYNKLILNIHNFRKSLYFKQFSRACFFLKYKQKNFYQKNLYQLYIFNKFSTFNKNLLNIKIFDIFVEKFRLIYINKNFFSYLILLCEFFFLVIKNLVMKYKIKKTKKNLISFLQKPNMNNVYYSKNYWEYIKIRQYFFEEYIKILDVYNKEKIKLNLILPFSYAFLKKIYLLFISILTLIFIPIFKINIISIYVFYNLINLFYFLFIKHIFLVNNYFFTVFFTFIMKLIYYFFGIYEKFCKFINSFFLSIKNIIYYNRLFKPIFFFSFLYKFYNKIYYKMKFVFFSNFIISFVKSRNLAFLEILAILFTIKKDLKIRQKNLMNQTKTRQMNDFKDIDIQEFINNVIPEEKNHDFFFLSNFFRKKIRIKTFSKRRRFFVSTELMNRKLIFNTKLIKAHNNKLFLKMKIKNLYFNNFFFKYNLSLFNNEFLKETKNTNLFYFFFRKIFYSLNIYESKKKLFHYFLNLENYFKINNTKFSNKLKLMNIKFINNFLILKKKKKN